MATKMIVHGVPGSPYVRATLLTLEEKGAEYELAAMALGALKQQPHLSRHPFGRIPAFDPQCPGLHRRDRATVGWPYMDGWGCDQPRRSAAGVASVDVRAERGGCADIARPPEFEGLARPHRSAPKHAGDDLGQAARTGSGRCVMPTRGLAPLILALAVASPAAAEVKSGAPNGFEVASTVTISAPADRVYVEGKSLPE